MHLKQLKHSCTTTTPQQHQQHKHSLTQIIDKAIDRKHVTKKCFNRYIYKLTIQKQNTT